ncbi:hypothetical protein [Heyndrickxia coagulans]|uniref:Uncharacterized protein n=1 Tax=Heyndrickxia coagulans TaxID=1398 RepID=A0AAN0WDY6_HEYCO|nr:hypothetical protein [Heyndrickxia coagulans]AJO24613.1 hypothetical protein SB48_HM08orf06071 [Heyndrickxia coagulans]
MNKVVSLLSNLEILLTQQALMNMSETDPAKRKAAEKHRTTRYISA